LYPAGNLFIPVEHGRLEAILKEPSAAAGEYSLSAHGVALVLHPHPLHGGTMHTKVVFRAARALNDAGLVALRINFRGVGQSTGTHDHARGEQDDARAALDYLTNTYPNLPVTLAGFSFGARIALDVGITDPRVQNLIGIGAPVDKYDFTFLRDCRKPLLLVHGEHDEFGRIEKLQTLVATLPPEATTQLSIVAAAAHFFDTQLDQLSRIVAEWTFRRVSGEQ